MFSIDKMSRKPIYEQLIESIEKSILAGTLPEDGQLPSVRSLSQELGINPNTLQKAYAEIERRGLCYTVPGSGRFIARDAVDRLLAAGGAKLSELEELLVMLRDAGVGRSSVEETVARVFEATNINDSEVDKK